MNFVAGDLCFPVSSGEEDEDEESRGSVVPHSGRGSKSSASSL